MKLHILSVRGTNLGDLEFNNQATIKDLKESFTILKPKYYTTRQRWVSQDGKITFADDSKKLTEYGLKDGDNITFKDLGPQIGWTTVFITEYSGPIIVYLFFFLRPDFLYGETASKTPLLFEQKLAAACWVGHYLKRILETLFVHRFSNETMPLFNIFKNSGYYWGASALTGYFINHPLYTPTTPDRLLIGLTIFLISEISNAITHIQLRNLRPPGTKTRGLPKGFLFEYVSCPNYTTETLSWIGFSIMTQSLASWFFMLGGFIQMYFWALKKHSLYRKDFNGKDGKPIYPKNRRIIIPFIL